MSPRHDCQGVSGLGGREHTVQAHEGPCRPRSQCCGCTCAMPPPLGRDHRPVTDCYQVKSHGPCSGPSLARRSASAGKVSFFHVGSSRQITKPKLRPPQHRLCSVAKEWRNGNEVHRPTSRPPGESGLILKSKDKGRRSEANDGDEEAFRGRGRAFPKGVGYHLLSPVFGPSCPVMATGKCVT